MLEAKDHISELTAENRLKSRRPRLISVFGRCDLSPDTLLRPSFWTQRSWPLIAKVLGHSTFLHPRSISSVISLWQFSARIFALLSFC